MAEDKVRAAAAALVARFQETTAVNDEVGALAAALAEQPIAPPPSAQ